jgi:hypothetical protein
MGLLATWMLSLWLVKALVEVFPIRIIVLFLFSISVSLISFYSALLSTDLFSGDLWDCLLILILILSCFCLL